MENKALKEYHKFLMDDINRRLFVENQSRIAKCLELIDENQLWYKHNENVNSIGNLVLHLCGNITQYICAGILREKDIRIRDLEFVATSTHTKQELLDKLNETMTMIEQKLKLITPEMLIKEFEVQGFKENGTSILVHVTEHFSYHVGQITYLTKFLNNVDTKYYGDLDLNAKSS